jgi:hypothetical protein
MTVLARRHRHRDPETTAAHRTYADGHPFDVIHYLQSKLILRPDRFTSVERFRSFGKLVRRTAQSVPVDFVADPEGSERGTHK